MKKTSKKVILYRIDGLDQQTAVLDGRLDALQTAVSGVARRLGDLTQELADLELLRKRIEELEDWQAQAAAGCSTLRRIKPAVRPADDHEEGGE